MSYIRSLSNPEGLYVYCGVDGKVHITFNVKAPFSNCNYITVPNEIFDKVGRGFLENWDQSCYKGFIAEEIHVFEKTGERIPENYDFLRTRKSMRFVVKLSYQGKFVYLWRVTWMYVCNNIVQRKKKARKKK